MSEEIQDLVEKAQKGDKEAFRDLFERFGKRVLAVVYGVLKNHEQAQEVTQEAFIKAYKNLHLFHHGSSFYTWLYRIAVNTAIDARRKKGSAVEVIFDEQLAVEQGSDYDALITKSTLPDKALENKDSEKYLKGCLEKIPESQRLAVILKDIEELSYQEIAEVMQCSIGTVMSRIHYGRKRLKEIIFREKNERRND
jgi:RNA polymerase sigma-70 factor (ECF subfamily)